MSDRTQPTHGQPSSENSFATSESWFTPGRFAGLLALFICGAFPKVILGFHTLCYRDFGVLAYPVVFYHHESFWRGELPLWNPLSNCGAPFLAQWGTMVLYPFSLFYLALPLPWSLNVFCLGHLFWAGLGMYLLAWRWTGSRFAACWAGVAFVFNGVTLSCLIWPNYLVALGWMPWVVLWVERAWREGGRCTVAAAIIATMQMLSGVPEIVLLTWLLLAGLWLGAFIGNHHGFVAGARGHELTPVPLPGRGAPLLDVAASSPPGRRAGAARFLGPSPSPRLLTMRGALVVALVSGLMAVQLLPFFDLLAHSQRDPGFATSKWAMPAWGWANLFVPLFRCFLTPQGVFFQIGQEFMSSTYLGVATMTLGVFAACFVRRPRVWLLSGLALFCLVMALGEHGFVYGWIRQLIPLVGIARYPIKFMALAAFVVPMLAAYGVLVWEGASRGSQPRARRRLIGLGLGAAAAITVVLWVTRQFPSPYDQWPAIWQGALWRGVFLAGTLGLLAVQARMPKAAVCVTKLVLLIAIALDAMTHVPRQNPALPASVLAPGLWELSNKVPAPKHGEGRVMISPRAEAHLLLSRVPSLSDDLLGKRLALWSHLNLLEGIPKVNGSSTLQLREQAQVQSLLYGSNNTDLPRLADFLGVSHTTAPGQIVDWSARETHLPLVTAGQRPAFAAATDILSALTNATFDPVKVVYLPPEAKPFITATNEVEAKIISPKFTPHHIGFEIEAKGASIAVIAQSFYHPWHAYVDGKATPLWRANHACQALEIKAGRHRVELVYEDGRFRLGAIVSGLAVLLCGLLWFRRPTDNNST